MAIKVSEPSKPIPTVPMMDMPFSILVRMIVRGSVATTADAFAKLLAQRLRAALAERGVAARLLGPAACPIARLRGKSRFHLLVQAADGAGLRECVRQAMAALQTPRGVQWLVDIDPLDML